MQVKASKKSTKKQKMPRHVHFFLDSKNKELYNIILLTLYTSIIDIDELFRAVGDGFTTSEYFYLEYAYMSYKISLAGDLGSGKSTVAAMLIEKYPALEYYSTGALMREIAKRHGFTIEELNVYMETHPEIDREIDDGLCRLSEDNRDLIIDSRMAWHFVKGTFKVYLSCDIETSAARILSAKRDEEPFSSFNDALKGIRGRRASEKKRYKEQYGVDIKNMSNYDLVLDTTYINPSEVAEYLTESFEAWKQNNSYKGCFICPERLMYDSDEVDMESAMRLSDKLDETGVCDEITVREHDGNFYVDEGTNSALAYSLSSYPLVPSRLISGAPDLSREYVKMKNSL